LEPQGIKSGFDPCPNENYFIAEATPHIPAKIVFQNFKKIIYEN